MMSLDFSAILPIAVLVITGILCMLMGTARRQTATAWCSTLALIGIATAVTAVKMGAVDYLAKPADADEIYHALMATQIDKPDAQENPMSADRVRWEHIQRVFESCDRNVSETARRLNMHRRTLQRILAKRAPR